MFAPDPGSLGTRHCGVHVWPRLSTRSHDAGSKSRLRRWERVAFSLLAASQSPNASLRVSTTSQAQIQLRHLLVGLEVIPGSRRRLPLHPPCDPALAALLLHVPGQAQVAARTSAPRSSNCRTTNYRHRLARSGSGTGSVRSMGLGLGSSGIAAHSHFQPNASTEDAQLHPVLHRAPPARRRPRLA